MQQIQRQLFLLFFSKILLFCYFSPHPSFVFFFMYPILSLLISIIPIIIHSIFLIQSYFYFYFYCTSCPDFLNVHFQSQKPYMLVVVFGCCRSFFLFYLFSIYMYIYVLGLWPSCLSIMIYGLLTLEIRYRFCSSIEAV